MAARQRETRHELDDGFVVAWDSSELDENLRKRLIELADQQIGQIVVEMGGVNEAVDSSAPPPSRPRRRGRRRRAAA